MRVIYLGTGIGASFIFLFVIFLTVRSAWGSAENLAALSPILYFVAAIIPAILGLGLTLWVKPRVDILKSGRSVPSDLIIQLQAVRSDSLPPEIWIGYVNDLEAQRVAQQIRAAFENAGWKTHGNQPPEPNLESFKGIRFIAYETPSHHELRSVHRIRQDAVRSALKLLRETYEEIPNPSDSGVMVGSIVVGSMSENYPLSK